MMRELERFNVKIFTIIVLFSLCILLTGCSGSTGINNRVGPKYYQGYSSVEMAFLDDSPPMTFYYDSEGTTIDDNTIPIMVQVANKGSSNSYGALFIHGLDPNIVAIQGYNTGYGDSISGRSSEMFSGFFANSDNFGFSITGIDAGSSTLNLGLQTINGRTFVSFSTFGSGSGIFSNRNALFSQLGFTTSTSRYSDYDGISTGVLQYGIGSALNVITTGMFSSFGWNEWLKKFELEGRNSYNPAGGMEVIEFPATILTLPPSLEQFRQRIMITSCFDYATHASDVVCIDPEPYSNVKKACRPTTVSLGGGQGAPVAVTTIEQKPGRGKTTFIINIHHNSRAAYDELYDYFSLYKCDPASGEIVKATDKNVVYVGYVYLSDIDITMSCIPQYAVRLDEGGNGQITCSIDYPPGMATSAYMAPMEIELWYGYSKTIFRDIIIRNI
ncbi:MAG: hypothetical protein ACP5OA_06490 [Candidatus Woesearchaeota archaeon]